MRAAVDRLLREGRVRVVERAVSGRFELAAVTQASQRESDAPLLFRRVGNSRFPVVTNLFGSRDRMMAMIGAEDSFCRRWAELMRAPGAPPRMVGEPAGLEEIRLSDLPAITYSERDGGPYITAGVFLAKEPESGIPNLSFHRCQVVGDRELRVRLGSSHHLTRYQAGAEAQGEALEAAILLGAPPPLVLAAAAPLAYDEDEMEVAAKIAGAPLALRRCRTVALDVPAETEIVIEGRILPGIRRPEGPFGEFMGYYVEIGDNHVFEVSAVVARPDALYHALLCGSPEDLRLLELAVATRTYQALLAANLRGIVDVACTPFTMSTVVKMEQAYEGHARQVLMTAVGANHDWNKTVFAVDEDVDIGNFDDVWWAYLTRGRADSRAFVLQDLPGFYRDPMKDHWGRLAIDATAPFGRKSEFVRKRVPGAEAIRLADYLA
ncbi:UbiD family decarboxylase [Rhizobiales bacterium L72]|uniref:UbiD family decarboxylase n=2 Tax=Propylenella binzhouense TaxID=2555902 RepID=A0A964T564_9HYPH|nr:UbiD family decarboxylase [Propylenella binzhouense]MYZ48615.1 UbiD family decarboxylase [Propylenella binzhouense]